jgi:hypothetical protein
MQGNDDLNALLSSLGMPAFSSQPPPPAPPSALAPASVPPFNASIPAPDLSLEALTALLQPSAAPAVPSTSSSAHLDLFGGSFGSSAPMDASNLGAFDYTSLLANDGTGAGGGGLADLDFSGLGAGEFDMNANADLDELLKNLG